MLADLTKQLTGFFTTTEQAKQDTSFFDIHLHMVRIWPDRTDGVWLYVEQAESNALAKPYRQRVNHLWQVNDTLIHSQVYELPQPLRFVGAWKQTKRLNALTPDSLIGRAGCLVPLQRSSDGRFSGSTPPRTCLSTWKGAAYTTTEVLISNREMISWDRGWNQQGEQVWGSRRGGYRFIKQR